MPAGIILDRRK